MNEIEKLYKNAGLSNMWVEEYDDKRFWHGCYIEMIQSMMKLNNWDRKTATSVAHKECRKALPPFTAEKQLELIKLLCQKRFIELGVTADDEYFLDDLDCCQSYSQYFEEAVAGFINTLWQSLTEEEKEQIRGILI